jgi:hypothetical protein
MEMSQRRLLQVMQMAVGWLTQDHMSQSVQHPSPDVVVTADNLLHIWISPSNVTIYYHVSLVLQHATLFGGFMEPLMLYRLTICLQKRKHHHRIQYYWKLENMMVKQGTNSMVIKHWRVFKQCSLPVAFCRQHTYKHKEKRARSNAHSKHRDSQYLSVTLTLLRPATNFTLKIVLKSHYEPQDFSLELCILFVWPTGELYRVIREERWIFTEVIISAIVRKEVHINMCLKLDWWNLQT